MVLTTGFISVWLTLRVGFPPLSLSLNQNILVRNLCSLFYRDSDGVVAPSLRTSFDYIDLSIIVFPPFMLGGLLLSASGFSRFQHNLPEEMGFG